MAYYRKKPVVIKAVQWYPGTEIEGVRNYINCEEAYVETIEGRMKLRPGDYVITGVRGEIYPCRQDIFEETYEEVELLSDLDFDEYPEGDVLGVDELMQIMLDKDD